MLEKEEEKRFGGWESLKNERIAKKKKDHRFAWHYKKKNAVISQTGKKKACGMAGSAEFCFVFFYEEALQ